MVNASTIVGVIEAYLLRSEQPLKEPNDDEIIILFATISSESSTCLMVCSQFFERRTVR
jgi:hypothetical protein